MNRRHFLGGTLATLTVMTQSRLFGDAKPATNPAAKSVTKPNFILLLSDDQNWDGLSVSMDPKLPDAKNAMVETPSLEAFAASGMRFTQAYAPAPVCSPSRVSIQTGKNPIKLGWTRAGPSVRASQGYKLLVPQSAKSLPESEITIAELLKTAGYATAHYGKWHLSGGGPAKHGYDKSDGDTENKEAASFKTADNPLDIVGMGQRAAAFMKQAKSAGAPFFIQMSYYPLHFPQNARATTIAKYKTKLRGPKERPAQMAAAAEDLDTGVGELLKAIDALGLRKTTYVIYMGDNGGGGSNTLGGDTGRRKSRRQQNLRGGKGGLLEGGIRIPFIIRGPGITANSVCRIPVVGFDFLPTFCALGGVTPPLPKNLDGGDFSHLLTGSTKPVKRPQEEIVFHFPHYQADTPHSAIRLGDYKLLHYYEDDRIELYDLATDRKEAKNLATKLPKKAAEMKRRLAAYLKANGAKLPSPNSNFDPANPPELPKGKPGGKESRTTRKR